MSKKIKDLTEKELLVVELHKKYDDIEKHILTEEDIVEIKNALTIGVKGSELGRIFKVSRQTINLIKKDEFKCRPKPKPKVEKVEKVKEQKENKVEKEIKNKTILLKQKGETDEYVRKVKNKSLAKNISSKELLVIHLNEKYSDSLPMRDLTKHEIIDIKNALISNIKILHIVNIFKVPRQVITSVKKGDYDYLLLDKA